jgi:hypothetical protein
MDAQSVRCRIKDILKMQGYSVLKLSNGNPSLQVKLNKHINGNTTISLETIELILSTFPNVSAEWLLRGTGEMFLDGSTPVRNNRNEQKGTAERVAGGVPSAETYIADLQRQIAELRKDKELLGGLLQQLTKK